MQLKITNSLGMEVYCENIVQSQKELLRSIDVSHFAKGIYFIELLACDKKEVRRVILNY